MFIVLALVATLVVGLSAQKKLTVWCWDPNFNVYAMKQAALVYNKTHPDVNIEVVDMAQDIEAKIISGLQAGGAHRRGEGVA